MSRSSTGEDDDERNDKQRRWAAYRYWQLDLTSTRILKAMVLGSAVMPRVHGFTCSCSSRKKH